MAVLLKAISMCRVYGSTRLVGNCHPPPSDLRPIAAWSHKAQHARSEVEKWCSAFLCLTKVESFQEM
jgi:hypothetical protein